MRKVESSRTRRTRSASGFFLVRLFRFQRDDAKNVSHIFREFEFEMRFRSVRVQRLPRFAIDRHAAEVPFL
jgi:hypothetical protein